jgi:hypothetical protein
MNIFMLHASICAYGTDHPVRFSEKDKEMPWESLRSLLAYSREIEMKFTVNLLRMRSKLTKNPLKTFTLDNIHEICL